jgi:predicted ATP-grasp superfamily ATP-dependent carboligase
MTRLTILGASARAAAFSAARAGYTPYSLDSFADCDLARLCTSVRIQRYPNDFVAGLAAAPEGPWLYTGGLENHPRLVQRLAKLRPLWGNSAEVLARVRDPWQLSATLAEAKLAYPPVARSATAGSWLVKPLRGSAGLGVRRASSRDLQKPPRGSVLQRYIAGESCSAVYVAAGGRAMFLGATRQLLGRDFGLAREFLYAGSIGPLVLRPAEQATLRRVGEVLAERFALVGLFGVDFVRTEDELWTVEVNPRYTASVEILERTSGRHFIVLHAAACQDGRLPDVQPPDAPRTFAGKAIVYATNDSVVSTQMPWMGREPESTWRSFADLPPAGQRIADGHPVVTVLGEGTSPAVVEATLREQRQLVLDGLGRTG